MTSILIAKDDSDHILVGTDGGGIYQSQDRCNNWETAHSRPANLFINSLAADPADPNILYAGTDGGAYISTDGGETWGQINDGLLGATVVYSIVVDKDSNVYAATPYGIFRLGSK